MHDNMDPIIPHLAHLDQSNDLQELHQAFTPFLYDACVRAPGVHTRTQGGLVPVDPGT